MPAGRASGSSTGGLSAGQRLHAGVALAAADLAVEADLLEPGDLHLSLAPGRMLLGQPLDQAQDAVAQLHREVGCRCAAERADLLDGYLRRFCLPGVEGFAHR
jgi:hypothetical protein